MTNLNNQKLNKSNFLILILLFAIVASPGFYIFIPFCILLSFIIFKDFESLYIFKRWKFILFGMMFIFVLPLVLGEKDAALAGIKYSSEYLRISTLIMIRGIGFYLAITVFSRQVSVALLSKWISQSRLSSASEAVPVAINLLPMLQKNAVESYLVFKYRGGFKRKRIKNLLRLILTILINTIKMAEDITQVLIYKEMSLKEK